MFSFLNLLVLILTVLSPVILASSGNANVECYVDPSIKVGYFRVRCKSIIPSRNSDIACCSISLRNSAPFDAWEPNSNYSKIWDPHTVKCEKLETTPNGSFKISNRADPMKTSSCAFVLTYQGNKSK